MLRRTHSLIDATGTASMSLIYSRGTNHLVAPEATAEAQGRDRRVRVWSEITVTLLVLLAATLGLLWSVMSSIA
jgi:hypothetical protein